MIPLKVVLLVSPVVSSPLPSVILPKPAIEPTVSLKSFRFHVAPEPTMTAETSAITSFLPLVTMPPVMVVLPL